VHSLITVVSLLSMSDDEIPQGGMDGMDDDMGSSDDGDMGEYAPPAQLPEGVTKDIMTPAPEENFKKPKTGDDVTVHYVGTLQADGSEFDSSRGRGDPFVFTLGKGQVIKGWDLGVATMKKGELAKFTLAPEFGYGESGSPPKIPENATLVFEVELISWASKDDLFGDEGVIKTQVTEGTGWKTPKAGDEVLISMKAEKEDGSLIEEKTDLQYVMGSGSLSVAKKACEQALGGMKRGEEAALKCSKDYSDVEGGVTVTLTLKEIFDTKDVSATKDGSMMKKQIKEGEGYDNPKDAAKVTLSVESATDGVKALPGFTPKVLEFTAGNGDVCDALEYAVGEMKKGERAVFTVTVPKLMAEAQLGLKDIAADKVVLELELKDFEKGKDTWSMSEEEKVEFGLARKDVATNLFKSSRFAMALGRYKKVADLFNYIDNFKEDNKVKAKELKKVCELNKAACYLKLEDWAEARKSCVAVLKDDGQNVKAIFRKAQADLHLKNYLDCMQDCKRVVELDAQNKDARLLLKKAQAGQKEEDKKSKGLFANMCKALGKGPIPEPFKAKKEMDDEYDEEEDMPMGGDEAAESAAEAVAAATAGADAAEAKDAA